MLEVSFTKTCKRCGSKMDNPYFEKGLCEKCANEEIAKNLCAICDKTNSFVHEGRKYKVAQKTDNTVSVQNSSNFFKDLLVLVGQIILAMFAIGLLFFAIPVLEQFKSIIPILIIVILIIVCVIYGIVYLTAYMTPENVESRRKQKEDARNARERRERIAEEERILECKRIEEEEKAKKELEMAKYQELRKKIEAMPLYETWKQDVFNKHGRKCAHCGSAENIEIHHLKSLGSIIKQYKITNTMEAFECPALWGSDNGVPLCKDCHDQTKSSKFFNDNSNKLI